MNLLDLSKLLFPTRGGLLPKGLVFLIDRMPCKLSAFFNLSLEEPIQHRSSPTERLRTRWSRPSQRGIEFPSQFG
jgi:hypothetical protein